MPQFTVKRIDRKDYDARQITAPNASEAAQYLIESDEHDRVEFPIASGHESAIVEVEGHGSFEVCGNPSPHYFTRRR